MNNIMPKEVFEFLNAYAKWAYEDGAPETYENNFLDIHGLCVNCARYGNRQGMYELEKLFIKEGLDVLRPFGSYSLNGLKKSENPIRREWVLRKIAEYEAAQLENDK